MMNNRDSQRARCYNAENNMWKLLSCNYNSYRSIGEAQEAINALMADSAFKDKFIPLDIRISDGRRRKSACCEFHKDKVDSWFVIRLPKRFRNALILMHELAHAYSYFKPWHGEQFCFIYLNLVELYMGVFAAELLRKNFDDFKVKYRI